MIGKEMQQATAFLILLELAGAGKFAPRRAGGFEVQIPWTTGRGGGDDRCTGAFVRHDVRRPEFFLQRRGKQNPLGKFPQFHCEQINNQSAMRPESFKRDENEVVSYS